MRRKVSSSCTQELCQLNLPAFDQKPCTHYSASVLAAVGLSGHMGAYVAAHPHA